jgi:hypothetical protein
MRAFIIIMVAMAALSKVFGATLSALKMNPWVLINLENYLLWFAILGFFVFGWIRWKKGNKG